MGLRATRVDRAKKKLGDSNCDFASVHKVKVPYYVKLTLPMVSNNNMSANSPEMRKVHPVLPVHGSPLCDVTKGPHLWEAVSSGLNVLFPGRLQSCLG